ncbi:FG-GAP repeat domain-containing protein [Agromyces sp. SYSU T00194]|uniref:FG-GAP repeat domain-containing protein n=1 Tax=Agromyces chitinivorans TaxID=3158560 RepID=UPI003393C3F7
MHRATLLSTVVIGGMLAAWTALPAQAASGGNGGGNALGATAAPTVAAPDTEPAFALPSWGDGQWGSSEDYETIQSADLDGDGDAELIGRSGIGLEAWDFDVTAGQWTPLVAAGGLGLTDEAGWDQKQYYETIGTADFDGDGADEVYTRNWAGIRAARLDTSSTPATWDELPDLAEYTTTQGWDAPEYYETLQAADLDGDGHDELFGRAASGIVIADYVRGGWAMSSFAWFSNAQGWDHPQYYETIQAADLDGDGRAEIVGRGTQGLEVWGLEDGDWVAEASSGPFPDSEYWNREEFYSTIQTADLDGDGDVEAIGRGTSGLHAFEFADATGKKNGGTWTELPELTAMSNGNGWAGAPRRATIQAADIDGDGRDEVIGRDNLTMVAWGFTASSKTWANEQLVDGPGFTDALGWDAAPYYETIQVVDVDGYTASGQPGSSNASRAELIGRGPNGIQTYRFDAKAGSWTSPSAAFPTFTGQALTAYQAISEALDVTTEDIRSRYDSGASTLGAWATAVDGIARPAGVSSTTWQQVQAQVAQELAWAHEVATASANLSELIGVVTELKGDDTTAQHLDYETSESNTASIAGNLLVMLAGFVDAASNLSEPGVMVALGALDSAASFAASDGQNGTASFEGTYLELEGAIEGWWGTAETANEQATAQIVADYGLLSTVGTLYADGTWTQFGPGDPGWAAAANASARAYSTWVWQTITPTLPQPCKDLQDCAGWAVATCAIDHCMYQDDGYEYSLRSVVCTVPWNCPPYSGDGFAQRVLVGDSVSNALMKQLTEPVSESCLAGWDPTTCNFGVSGLEIAAGLDGWQYRCSFYHPATSTFFPEEFCTALEDERALYGTRDG